MKKALAATTLLVLSSVVFVVPPARANHDPLESDLFSCHLGLNGPVMTGTTSATVTATYSCPTPRRYMTVSVWIEVFRPLAGGYSTVASDTSSSGSSAVPLLTTQLSTTVCLAGATQMRASARGHWVDSHGVQRGTRFDQSVSVPLTCSIR